jgi:serine/threonine-protein kinase RsbW
VNIDLAVTLPREVETVSFVRNAVAHALSLLGADDECIHDLMLAVSEACTNVIQHAETEDEYEVSVHVDEHRCSISVKDTGAGFDTAALAGGMPDPQSVRGRGVPIMRAVMDGFEFTSSPETGTIVRLDRELSTRKDAPLSRLRSKKHQS